MWRVTAPGFASTLFTEQSSSVNRRVSRYFDILIFCRQALAAFGIITHHDDQNPELSPASSMCQSTEQTTSGKATELLS